MRVERHGEVLLVRLSGDVDAASTEEVRGEVLGVVASGATRVIVDLTAVDFLDSAGIAMLAALYRELRERDGDVRVVAPPGRVRRMLELVRLQRVIPLLEDVPSALAALGGEQA